MASLPALISAVTLCQDMLRLEVEVRQLFGEQFEEKRNPYLEILRERMRKDPTVPPLMALLAETKRPDIEGIQCALFICAAAQLCREQGKEATS